MSKFLITFEKFTFLYVYENKWSSNLVIFTLMTLEIDSSIKICHFSEFSQEKSLKIKLDFLNFPGRQHLATVTANKKTVSCVSIILIIIIKTHLKLIVFTHSFSTKCLFKIKKRGKCIHHYITHQCDWVKSNFHTQLD